MKSGVRTRRRVSLRALAFLVLVFGAVLLGANAPTPTAATSPYTIVDLGTLNGWDTSAATAVSDRGEVVGFSYDTRASGTVEAFTWTRLFGMTKLGSGTAYGVNNLGQVVGQSAGHAVIWDRGDGIVDLGPGSARAVNDAGTVVGQNGERHAFVWTQAAGMVDLGPVGGISSSASAVSEAGQVVGAWTDSSYVNHGFLWSPGDGNPDFGANTTAAAVNDLGQVAGYAGVNSPPLWTHATLWERFRGRRPRHAWAELQLRPRHEQRGTGCRNEPRRLAGRARACVRLDQGSGMLDLGTLGGLSSNASDVNNRGLIVGGAYTAGAWPTSVIHATVWTAADTTPPAAPSTPDLWAGADTGRSNSDDITKSTMLSFSGTAEPDSTITSTAVQPPCGRLTPTGSPGRGGVRITR